MNKNLCRRLGNLSLPVLLSVVLLASCRDEIETGAYTGPYIRFSVSEGSEWHSTRAAGGPAEKAVPRDSVQPLHGGDGNTPLYLHTLYTDSIASPSSDVCPDTAVLTRATPVKDDNMYGSFGVSSPTPVRGAKAEPRLLIMPPSKSGSGDLHSSYYWRCFYKMKFFAYAPKDNGQYVLRQHAPFSHHRRHYSKRCQ